MNSMNNSNDSNNVEGNLYKKKKKKSISASGSSFKATAQFHYLRTQLPEANPDVTVQ